VGGWALAGCVLSLVSADHGSLLGRARGLGAV